MKNILSFLEEKNLVDNSIVLIVSDHGSSIGEKKGEKMYGSFVYDYTLKVFSMIKVPGKGGKEIKFQTRHIDIMPTILELFNFKKDKRYKDIQGKSLLSFIDGNEKKDRIAFSETGGLGGPWPSKEKHNVFCIRSEGYKIIFNSSPHTWEFYNINKDPCEKNNLIKTDSDVKMKLIDLLLNQMEENKRLSQ